MAYITSTAGCCLCPKCWDLAAVPHDTRGVVFTVREMGADGFEHHVIQGGFPSRAAAEEAFKIHQEAEKLAKKLAEKIDTRKTWVLGAAHYRKLAADRADEGTGVQLACLVLADRCVHQILGDHGGPSLEMVLLAENTVGERIDEVVAGLLTEQP